MSFERWLLGGSKMYHISLNGRCIKKIISKNRKKNRINKFLEKYEFAVFAIIFLMQRPFKEIWYILEPSTTHLSNDIHINSFTKKNKYKAKGNSI